MFEVWIFAVILWKFRFKQLLWSNYGRIKRKVLGCAGLRIEIIKREKVSLKLYWFNGLDKLGGRKF